MTRIILVSEIKRPVVAHHVIGQTAYFGIFHLYIRGYSTAVAHNSSGSGGECRCQAVGNTRHGAVGITMGIIDSLDQTAARNIVAGHSHFQQAFVGEFASGLHESLAKRPTAQDDRSVEILKGTGGNLGGRGGSLVDQHHQRQLRSHGLI